MYKLKLYIFKSYLLIKKITNRICWILDIALYGSPIDYHNWLQVEKIDNVIRLINTDLNRCKPMDYKYKDDLQAIKWKLIIKKGRYKKW